MSCIDGQESSMHVCMLFRILRIAEVKPNFLHRMLQSRQCVKVLARIWNRRNQALNDTLLCYLNPQPTDRILEIGFGGAYLLEKILPHLQTGMVCGVDISEGMVRRCSKQFRSHIASGKLDLKCSSAEKRSYPARHFGKVCMANSIFYWQDAEAGMMEIHRSKLPNP